MAPVNNEKLTARIMTGNYPHGNVAVYIAAIGYTCKGRANLGNDGVRNIGVGKLEVLPLDDQHGCFQSHFRISTGYCSRQTD